MKTVSYIAARSRTTPSVRDGLEACDTTCDVEVVHAERVRTARAAFPTAEQMRHLLDLFALLSNPTRLAILVALRARADTPERELCVCDLTVLSGASQSMTSHQLRILREAGLVTCRRDGRLVYYSLLGDAPRALLDAALGYVSMSPKFRRKRR